MPAPSPISRFRSRAFSLVELLVVVAVIAVLFTLTLLAIGNLGQSRRLTVAGNLTVDLINHARQVAKSRNTLTLVALIDSGADSGRALATFAYAATHGAAGAWSQLDPWSTLPEGIEVDLAASAQFFQATPPVSVPHPSSFTRGGQTVTCATAIFLPDGRTVNPSTAPQVIILRGAESPADAPNFYKIIINQATGIPTIRRP